MLGQAEFHALPVRRLFPQGEDVLVRADVHAVHAVDLRVVVEEVVVVGGLGHQVPCAGLPVPLRQAFGIEVLRLPHGADILPADLRRMAVVAQVVFILGRAFDIHVPGVPVPEHRDALRSPVAPDAELGVPEPFRRFIAAQGFKGGFKMLAHQGFLLLFLNLFPVLRPMYPKRFALSRKTRQMRSGKGKAQKVWYNHLISSLNHPVKGTGPCAFQNC